MSSHTTWTFLNQITDSNTTTLETFLYLGEKNVGYIKRSLPCMIFTTTKNFLVTIKNVFDFCSKTGKPETLLFYKYVTNSEMKNQKN